MGGRYWRTSALAGLFGLVISVGMGVDLAAAHPGDEDQADSEHAKQDLAGTSIEQIERKPAPTPPRSRTHRGHTRPAHGRAEVPNASVSAAAAGSRSGRCVERGACRPRWCRSFRRCCRTARS